ncbi:MAG TPA: MotA/TolQ/ExbB proton channel family protein, partial [Candidatus Hydrogenedentes bacterium]|nr:MotA/TolQ/ExbB proton channel family protein [Candidatus Hydrogenedentota bacterium]
MNLNIIEIIRQGGILMWPIMFTSVVGMAIVIERWLTLRRADIDTREFMDTMRQVIRQNRIQEAINICDETDAPVARIIKAGLLKHRQSREIIREAIEDAGRFEIPRLERYLSGLATCATIAPMLGLLGTVQGMILAFAQIQNKRGQVNPSDLAEG